MTGEFALHPRLESDTAAVGRLPLSLVRFMRDARYPWALLVPVRAGAREIHELAPADRAVLIEEIATVSRALEQLHGAVKMNVGALGNVVPQLHVHVIARFPTDSAWPGPVWGAHPALPYDEAKLAARVAALRDALARAELRFVAD